MPIKHLEFPIWRKCCQRDPVRIKPNFEFVLRLMLLLLATTSAFAQVKSSTIIVLGESKHKIVIAADSRMSEEDGSYRDDGCKIAALNNKFLFATSGRSFDITHGIVGWDATEQARTALALVLQAERTTELTHSFVMEIANEWATLIFNNVTAHIRPEEFVTMKQDQLFVDGTFITLEAPEPNIAYTAFRRDGNTTKFLTPMISTGHLPDKMAFTAIGSGYSTFIEFLNNTSPRAKKEQRITTRLAKRWEPEQADARMAIRLVDLVIKYSPEPDVGGRVDAADLTVGQPVHWIQRKPNCKDN
ncbi:MAG: hypothetical protein ACLPVW_08365 [Terriglobales bacterium]